MASTFLTLLLTIGSLAIGTKVYTSGIPSKWKVKSKKEIVSLKDNVVSGGEFILGSGSVNKKMYYYYYIKNEDGGYKMKKADVHSATIYEDANKNPYIVKLQEYQEPGDIRYFPVHEELYNFKKELHVPERTIIKNMRLDSE